MSLDYINMGLNDVQSWDGSITMLTPGDYIFEITDVEGGESRAGKPKLTLKLKVVDCYNEEGQVHIGEQILQSFSLDRSKDAPRRRMKALVEATGVSIDEKGGFDPNMMIGVQYVAEVRHETREETDAMTGEKKTLNGMKVFRERALSDVEAEEPAPEPPRVARAPRANGEALPKATANPRGRRTPAPAR